MRRRKIMSVDSIIGITSVIVILALATLAGVLVAIDHSNEIDDKTITYLKSKKDRGIFVMVFEDKKNKAYYYVKSDNYLYDNQNLKRGDTVEAKIKGTLRSRNYNAQAKINDIDDEWRGIKITKEYTDS